MNSKKTLVFLHGWGVSSEIWKPLHYFLQDNFNIRDLDLPGFGRTPIEKPMALKDYAGFVHEFLAKNQIEKPIIIGHSFGGAVAVKFALLYPDKISKLILIGAAAVRKPHRKMIFIKKAADILKPFLPEKTRKIILKILGYDKMDYAKIESPELKETFRNIIKEDLGPYFHSIKTQTLIIWGEKDAVTPLAEGKIIADNIPDAKFEIIKNTGHFVFLEKPNEFVKLIKEFTL